MNLRLRLAKWIAPKGFLVILESLLPKGFGEAGFTDIPYYKGKPIERDNMGHNPILQEQFDGLADVVDDGTDVAEYGGMTPGNPSDLWRETRKQLVEDKTDGNQD